MDNKAARSDVFTVRCGWAALGEGSFEYGYAESIVEDEGNAASISRKSRKG